MKWKQIIKLNGQVMILSLCLQQLKAYKICKYKQRHKNYI